MLKAEIIPAILALLGALSAAIGIVIRQRSAHSVTEGEVGHLTLFSMLVRNRRWWLGGIGDIASNIFIAVALYRGSVMLVTCLQVTVLLFALPIYAKVSGHRITRSEWVWAVVLAAALALLIVVGDPTAGEPRGAVSDWLIVAPVMGAALVLCVLGARVLKGRPASAVLLAAVNGASIALFAVLTKTIVHVLHHGDHQLLDKWEFYVWILAAVSGIIFQQSAFRAGSLTASLPTMIVARPVVAVILGVTVLKETLQLKGRPEWTLLIALTVLVIVATVMLARGEAATIEEDEERDLHRVTASDEPNKVPSERLGDGRLPGSAPTG
ncbi:hypothetical protein A5791_23470 [Mycobacterium sp. 852002-51163_SCH5372311]|uniref:DMT family transporter n=1 Tax=Mycobacterium sp. 852002-51163_SCH5372311 TaxID=1834097 RepID=UPI0008002FE0|nr:DMT family transporter [Mycobacterium sp. 852002-51163_SCH5372311]OBF84983.1 hypothetical protein A5791_23470 [Mycobacterium sp. 852002-51163_SCH5372311]